MNASRSATGRPILANDPHLSPTIPSHWYLACLETPDYKLRGAALAGTPFFSLGHNQHAAWGVTGGSADNTDLFLEKLDQDEPWSEMKRVFNLWRSPTTPYPDQGPGALRGSDPGHAPGTDHL